MMQTGHTRGLSRRSLLGGGLVIGAAAWNAEARALESQQAGPQRAQPERKAVAVYAYVGCYTSAKRYARGDGIHVYRVRTTHTRGRFAMKRNHGVLAGVLILMATLAPVAFLQEADPAHGSADLKICSIDVFTSGQDGCNTYRIPAIETAPDGTLLAFAEARKYNAGDPGRDKNDIDLVMKRSTDSGLTWSAMRVIEDPGELWSAANPSTMVDRTNRKIWLFYIRSKPGRGTDTSRPGTDDMQTLARTSDDNGLNWSEPVDLTAIARDMTDPHWRSSVIGPGGAIQTRKGRLIAPVWKFDPFEDLAIFSDDQGRTWQRGERVPGGIRSDESQLVELRNGRILMDFRQSSGPHRWMAVSKDGGRRWSEPRPGVTVSPVACAIARYTLRTAGDDRDRILWSGPSGPGRMNLVIRISYDEGRTFRVERAISEGLAAYSDITVLKDKSVGVLWERGVQKGYQFITFTRLSRDFLEPRNQ